MHFTDDSQQSLSCYRQTPLPRKLIPIAKGNVFFNDQGAPADAVPFVPQSIPSDKGRWLSIAGLALTNDENICLFVIQNSELSGLLKMSTGLLIIRRERHHSVIKSDW